jgi:hypothetical protein
MVRQGVVPSVRPFSRQQMNGQRSRSISERQNSSEIQNLSAPFASLSAAEEETAQSRIYLGIHWAFDNTHGITQGRRVADYVFEKASCPNTARSHTSEAANRAVDDLKDRSVAAI